MKTKITFLPLPDSTQFLHGFYGLEACSARGVVRIHNCPSKVTLKLSLSGKRIIKFFDSINSSDFIDLDQVLFENSITLLENVVLDDIDIEYLDIPFELALPGHEPISPGFGPCNELLPPSFYFNGGHGTGSVAYELLATLYPIEENRWFQPRALVEQLKLEPFLVYDPRLVPMMLNQDIRRWRSSYQADPVEYDIQVGKMVMGANDILEFKYRMLVQGQQAQRGVRIRKVRLTLNEIQIIGQGRCCIRDDDPNDVWHKPTRRRIHRELLYWEKTHQPTRHIERVYDGLCEKPAGLCDLPPMNIAEDGIYCHGSTILQLPAMGQFIPTTPKLVIGPDDHICKKKRDGLIQIRHTVKVYIELVGVDPIVIESGLYLLSVGINDCYSILDSDPEVLPNLDYEKLIGLEQWVPEYQPQDPFPVNLEEEEGQDPTLNMYHRGPSVSTFDSTRNSVLEVFPLRTRSSEHDIPYLIQEAMEQSINS